MTTYIIVRLYQGEHTAQVLHTGLSYAEAVEHCNDKETSSSTCTNQDGLNHTEQFGAWFDAFNEE